MNGRIVQNPIDIWFYLCLPQPSYDLNTGDLVQTSRDLSVLGSTILSPQRVLGIDQEASSGDEEDENSDDDEDKTENQAGRMLTKLPTPHGITSNAVTSKMSRLVGSQTTKGIITSYFGDKDILDNQKAFD